MFSASISIRGPNGDSKATKKSINTPTLVLERLDIHQSVLVKGMRIMELVFVLGVLVVGVPVREGKSYAQEFYFSGDSEIINFCMRFDWMSVCSKTATSLMQWQVYEEVLKRFELYPTKYS